MAFIEEILDIYISGRYAGVLTRTRGGRSVAITYDDHYRADPGSTPLSISMPLTVAEHEGSVPENWLDNLLPDNDELRERMRVKFGERSRSPFALLRHVGLDVAGAAQFVPRGADPAREGRYRPWSEAEISAEIRSLHADASAIDPSTERGLWSLAGANGKFALALRDGKRFEPTGSAPSTHVFKVGTHGVTASDLAEFVTMRAASRMGLRVASVRLAEFDGELAVIVERYDRLDRHGEVLRVHQEDMCQAMGVSPALKYQADGGPSIADVAGILGGYVPRRMLDRVRGDLARWHGFNMLTASTDGHAKNVSMLLSGRNVVTAPSYDLISAALVFDEHDVRHRLRMAMKFGGDYGLRGLDGYRIANAAEDLGVDPDWYVSEMRRMGETMGEAFSSAIGDAEAVAGRTPVLEEMRRRVAMRVDAVRGAATTLSMGASSASAPVVSEAERASRRRPASAGDVVVADYLRGGKVVHGHTRKRAHRGR